MEYSFFGITDIDEIIGQSKYIVDLKSFILSVAESSTSVLICGPEGSGKKLIAKTIYAVSNVNNDICFYHFDCKKDLSVDKMMNDIKRISLFSSDITIFLEDIDRLDLIQQKQLYSLVKSSSYCFICSSCENLEELVENGSFDSDLLFLLSRVTVNTVSLQQHQEDVSLITEYYFNKFNSMCKNERNCISEIVKSKLLSKIWHGDVKELKMSIERAFLSSNNNMLSLIDFGLSDNTIDETSGNDSFNPIEKFVDNQISAVDFLNGQDLTLKTAIDNFKRDYVTKILEENNWNQTKTAKILGIQRTYVIKLVKDLNIKK